MRENTTVKRKEEKEGRKEKKEGRKEKKDGRKEKTSWSEKERRQLSNSFNDT
jgi:hypothetical protein